MNKENAMIRTLFSGIRKPIAALTAFALTLCMAAAPELPFSPFGEDSLISVEAASGKYCSSTIEAAEYIRSKLLTNTDTIEITVKNNFGNSSVFDYCYFLFDHLARGYTGDPDAGDALFSRQVTGISVTSSTEEAEITFTVQKYMTDTQRKAANEAAAAVEKQLGLSGLSSDYARIKAVHDYLVKNVKYDYSGQNHSLYDALVLKKSVCDGYSLAMYKMLNDVGIPCRMITGIGNGDNHAWNVVYLEGKWYQLDATWDANAYEQGVPSQSHEFFLKGTRNFPRHTVGKQTITDWNDTPYVFSVTDFTGTTGSSAGYIYPVMTAEGYKLDISKAKVSLSYSSYGYTGTAKRPSVTVKLGNTKLKANTDYTVAYKNNIEPGEASVVVTGRGQYAGTVTRTYHIGEAFSKISIPYSSYTYTGKAITPTVTVKNSQGAKLVKDKDYTVSYKNNVKVGIASITITGKGIYGGTRTKTFVVKPAKNEIKSITSANGAFKISWKKATEGAVGYQVKYSTTPDFSANVHSYTSTVLNDLSENFSKYPNSGETWYVKVRSFYTKDGKTTSSRYGNYSAVRMIRVK